MQKCSGTFLHRLVEPMKNTPFWAHCVQVVLFGVCFVLRTLHPTPKFCCGSHSPYFPLKEYHSALGEGANFALSSEVCCYRNEDTLILRLFERRSVGQVIACCKSQNDKTLFPTHGKLFMVHLKCRCNEKNSTLD